MTDYAIFIYWAIVITVGMIQALALRLNNPTNPSVRVLNRGNISYRSRFQSLATLSPPPKRNRASFSRFSCHQISMSIPHTHNTEDTDTSTTADTSEGKNIFSLSDILDYLDQVENHLRRPSVPASECHYSYQSDNDATFYKYVGATLAKPMLRTLIYGGIQSDDHEMSTELKDTRNEQRSIKLRFEERIRDERALLEFERMSTFVLQSLRPALLDLDQDLRNNFVPELYDRINQIEVTVEKINNGHKIDRKALVVSSRLASGRYYKGQLGDLVADLFPQLFIAYEKASQQITERDVFERLIHLELINNHADKDDFHKRRVKAAFDCLHMFYPTCSNNQTAVPYDAARSGAEVSKTSGLLAEQSCLSYIQEKCQGSQSCMVLTNVYINTRRNANSNEKYKPPRTRRNKDTLIWTDEGGADRYGVCSELDVLSLKKSSNTASLEMPVVESIWEVKRTISPSTLHDVLSKKLAALEVLANDSRAELSYMDGNDRKSVVPFIRQSRQTVLSFGIYGIELLNPANAADSIRSVAGANVVSTNLKEVVRAIERCNENKNSLLSVEVDTVRTLKIAAKLKNLIKAKMECRNQIQISLHIQQEVDFLTKRDDQIH